MRMPEGRFGHATLVANDGSELWLAGGQTVKSMEGRQSDQEGDLGDEYQATGHVTIYDIVNEAFVQPPL